MSTQAQAQLVEDVTQRAPRRPHRPRRSRGGANAQPRGALGPDKCMRCGRRKHQGAEKCPARNAICYNCRKKGHLKAYCFSKPSVVSAVAAEGHTEDLAFLGTVSTPDSSTWRSTLHVNGKRVQFKLDTGAEVSAVSEETHLRVYGKQLQSPTKVLYGSAYQPLEVLGQFEGQLRGKDRSHVETLFIVRGLKNNLLGLPALTALQLVQRMDTTYTPLADVKGEFPKVFEGLGNFGEPYSIALKEDAKPYALFTPRNVPIPLRGKVLDELNHMESFGVVSKVNEPTSWCAGLVVVSKKSGDVRHAWT